MKDQERIAKWVEGIMESTVGSKVWIDSGKIADKIAQEILKRLPKEETHPHLHHSTRDEDNETGWCDTCNDTFEKPTLLIAGKNAMLKQVKQGLTKE